MRWLSVGSKDIVVIGMVVAIYTPSSVAFAVGRDNGVDTSVAGPVKIHEVVEVKIEHNVLIAIAF